MEMERNNEMDILQRAEMRKIPFDAPEGYFENLEERLREKTLQTKPSGKWDWVKVLKASLALAASFLLVAGMGWGIMRLTSLRQNNTLAQNELTEEGYMMLDSLVNKFGAIEVVDIYHNSLAQDVPEEEDNVLSDDEYYALEEYITLMAPSYPGLIAEEITTNR